MFLLVLNFFTIQSASPNSIVSSIYIHFKNCLELATVGKFPTFFKVFFWFVAGLVNGAKTSNVLVLDVEKTDLYSGCLCCLVFLFSFSLRRCLLRVCSFLLFVVVFSLLLLFS